MPTAQVTHDIEIICIVITLMADSAPRPMSTFLRETQFFSSDTWNVIICSELRSCKGSLLTNRRSKALKVQEKLLAIKPHLSTDTV